MWVGLFSVCVKVCLVCLCVSFVGGGIFMDGLGFILLGTFVPHLKQLKCAI